MLSITREVLTLEVSVRHYASLCRSRHLVDYDARFIPRPVAGSSHVVNVRHLSTQKQTRCASLQMKTRTH